jgi:hypothetical protein
VPLPLTILFTAFFLFICLTPPFMRRFRTREIWPWALAASILMTYGAAGFYAGVLSTAGLFDRIPSFEYPIWHADDVITLTDGTHVVPHKPSSRIQLYDRDWRFMRGWRVRSGGGDFRILNASDDRIEVFIERGDFRDTFDRNGNRLDVESDVSGRPGTLPASSQRATLRTAPWLWPFSSVGLASLIWMVGLAILLSCYYRVNKTTEAESAGPRSSGRSRLCST